MRQLDDRPHVCGRDADRASLVLGRSSALDDSDARAGPGLARSVADRDAARSVRLHLAVGCALDRDRRGDPAE